jgi:hypothetical protein
VGLPLDRRVRRLVTKQKENAMELTQATRDVLAERARQIKVEGWDSKHDDDHRNGAMARAAAAYAWVGSSDGRVPSRSGVDGADLWPSEWASKWWKPKDRRSNLVRAGALILAELERLDREERYETFLVAAGMVAAPREPAKTPNV